MLEFEMTFEGGRADEGLIDFYDAARALAGFQRSLALTTHLVINGKIITQAPYAQGFEILIPPFERGSWKSKALVLFSTAVAVTSAGKDSPLGQIVTSIYDAALNNTMGFHVDYSKTLQQQYSEHLNLKLITEERIDSLCEKIEASVADMHRPLIISKTANRAEITACGAHPRRLGPYLSPLTYEYVKQTVKAPTTEITTGYVGSYNINSFKGRIYCTTNNRLIPFELEGAARNPLMIGLVTQSQHLNGQIPFDPKSLIEITSTQLLSPTGIVKRYLVSKVAKPDSDNNSYSAGR